MRPLAPFALLVSAVIGTSTASAATARPATTEIVQQRLSDGRILLTNTPVRGATTERTWQVPVEDPAAARQRALEVSAEAERVSERIQRMLDQERRADAESARNQIAMMEMEQQRENAFDDQGFTYGFTPYAPYGWAGQGFGIALRPRLLPHAQALRSRQSTAPRTAQARVLRRTDDARGVADAATRHGEHRSAGRRRARPAILCRRRPARAPRPPC